MINLTLPWPPSINTDWRNVKGRTLLSRKGREYKKTVTALVVVASAKLHLAHRLEVKIILHPPSRAKRDVDNSIKAVLDALQTAGVYKDDEQIDRLVVERGDVVKYGCAHITITKH